MIDKNSSIPIYAQLKEIIKERIENKAYLPGQMIPSEKEFTEKYNISRMTVRQAITDLVNEGILVREKGKGTYVAKNVIEKQLELQSFSQDMNGRGLAPGSRIIKFEEVKASEEVREYLKLEENDTVYFINRLRLADNTPMAMEYCYLPSRLFPNLFKYNMENWSLYEILKNDYQLKFGYAEQTIRAVKMHKNEAILILNQEKGFGLLASRILYSMDNVPVEYTKTLYHPERYVYNMILKPDNR
jgi:GntR family transcriptional regulator